MKVLLTGFGPFADVVDNPTVRIVEYFAESGAPDCDLFTCVLPVSFARADEEIRKLIRTQPIDVAILLGVAANRTMFNLEQVALNQDNARIKDCDGQQPLGTPIVAGGPERMLTKVECNRIREILRTEGFPVELSDDAGAYVCNRTYYAALNEIATNNLAVRCLFVHVPPDENTLVEPPAHAINLQTHISLVKRLIQLIS